MLVFVAAISLREPNASPEAGSDVVAASLVPIAQAETPKAPKPVEITIFKSNREAKGWEFLTRDVRKAIDEKKPTRKQWRFVIVHSSRAKAGNALMLHFYHKKVKKMPKGLAYHFVIGNGNGAGDGEIEVGPRWTKGQEAAAMEVAEYNRHGIHIALVGNFNEGPPTANQMQAMRELIGYLKVKIGAVPIKTHAQMNPQVPSCPGPYLQVKN